jgi:hypothetical protein
MAGRGSNSRASAAPMPNLFDPSGTIVFPPRVEVLGSIHGNQLFGYAHGGLTARTTVTAQAARGVDGFSCSLPSGAAIFIAPRKTSVLADATATLVIEQFATADELFDPVRQTKAYWSAPRPVNPRNEPLGDGERRCEDIVKSWSNRFKFSQEDQETGRKGLRRPQIGALYAVLAHWSTTEAAATVDMPTHRQDRNHASATRMRATAPRHGRRAKLRTSRSDRAEVYDARQAGGMRLYSARPPSAGCRTATPPPEIAEGSGRYFLARKRCGRKHAGRRTMRPGRAREDGRALQSFVYRRGSSHRGENLD